ncbi:UNVERIFIED_CONTAM: hypothetical protein NCL1_55749 [Trichonephila clavipes]
MNAIRIEKFGSETVLELKSYEIPKPTEYTPTSLAKHCAEGNAVIQRKHQIMANIDNAKIDVQKLSTSNIVRGGMGWTQWRNGKFSGTPAKSDFEP